MLGLLIAGVLPALGQEVSTDIVAETLANIPEDFGVIRVDALAAELAEKPPLLLDVREANEWDELGHILGAVHIPLRKIAATLDLLPADLNTPIVVYCKSGHRGAIAMTVLSSLGYTNVRNLSGGITGWIDAGNDVSTESVEFEKIGPAAIDAELVAGVNNYLENVLPQGWGIVTADNLSLELAEKPPFLLDVRENVES